MFTSNIQRIFTIKPRRREDERRAILKQVNGLAWLLDNSIPIPFSQYRVGIDAVIGLIPGLGDVVGLVMSSFIVLQAIRLGVPIATITRMVINVAIEATVGLIPFAGDLFDATFKANARNVQMLNQWVDDTQKGRNRRKKNDQALIAIVVGVLLGLIGVIGGLGVALFSWLLAQFR